MNSNKLPFLFLLLLLNDLSYGQNNGVSYYSANNFGIKGISKEISAEPYSRIDSVNRSALSKGLKLLSKNTAGLYVEFETNSSFINLKWELDSYKVLPNMTPLAVNGFDLYGLKDSKWQYVNSAIAKSANNQVQIIEHMETSMTRFRLYFPLYNVLNNLEIGIDKTSEIKAVKSSPKPKIVIYGSSITQGASASRPGMAYPAIIGRSLGFEVYNLGFSGSGKMDPEMAHIIKNIKADVIILDCVPNPSSEQIKQRTIPFVKILRQTQPNAPILMVESVFREAGNWNQVLGQRVENQNKAFYIEYQKLLELGYNQLDYIKSNQLIGNDHQATVDGVHFSDLGHFRMAKTIEEQLIKLLNLKQKE